MNTILVTGATGNIGRPLVTLLVDAGVRLRAVEKILEHPAQTFAQWVDANRRSFTN